MSRLRILALLTALVALTAAFAACGGGGSGDDPQQILDDATLEGIESGELELFLLVKSQGEEDGYVKASMTGPFQSKESADLPELAVTAVAEGKANGKDIDFDGGLTLLSDRAFVKYEGTDYEVDPTTFGLIKQSLEQAQNQGSEGNPADVTACQEAAEGMHFGDFVDAVSSESSAELDGLKTTKVDGNVETASAADAIIELAEDPACSAQLESAGGLSIAELEEAKDELTGAVKKAHVEIYVGEDDIVRKVRAAVTIEPKDAPGEKVDIHIGFGISGVNEPQEISAPTDAKPIQGLFQKLGVNPIELLEVAGSGEGLGELFEGLTESLPGGDSSGGADGSSSGGGGGQKAYLECLKGAKTPADLQQCASMIQ